MQAYNLTVQALNFGTVLGTVSIKNVVSVKPLSMKTVRCDTVTTAVRERSTHLSFYVDVEWDRIRIEKQTHKWERVCILTVFVPVSCPGPMISAVALAQQLLYLNEIFKLVIMYCWLLFHWYLLCEDCSILYCWCRRYSRFDCLCGCWSLSAICWLECEVHCQ